MSDDVQLTLLAADAAAIRHAFDPSRLIQARRLRSMTKAELADRVDVSPAALGQYEAGVAVPRSETLARLATELRQPVAFFSSGRPHARLDASMAHFRSLRSTRVKQRAKAVAFVEQVWELQYALEKRVVLPEVTLPGYGVDSHEGVASLGPVQAARLVRQQWGTPVGPLPHLVRELELHGVIVTLLSITDDGENARIDAFSTSRMPRPIIVLTTDRADDVFRSRFTAAHELGHLLLHRDVHPGDVRQESEADQFAAELLTPLEQIASELGTRVNLSKLQQTARRWGVSTASLVLRSREIGLISDVSARRAYQRLNEFRTAGGIVNEPISMFPGESPSMMRRAFDLAQESGLTVDMLAAELAWPPGRVVQLLDLDRRPTLTLA